jgi:hypothetical protein
LRVVEDRVTAGLDLSNMLNHNNTAIYVVGTAIIGIIAQYLSLATVFVWIEVPVAMIAVGYLVLSKHASHARAIVIAERAQ